MADEIKQTEQQMEVQIEEIHQNQEEPAQTAAESVREAEPDRTETEETVKSETEQVHSEQTKEGWQEHSQTAERKMFKNLGPKQYYKEEEDNFSREEWILSRIQDDDLMDYLRMEEEKEVRNQNAKAVKEKRIFTAFQMLISMLAIVIVVFLLKDNPTVLVNILYIMGIITALWILKNPKDKP